MDSTELQRLRRENARLRHASLTMQLLTHKDGHGMPTVLGSYISSMEQRARCGASQSPTFGSPVEGSANQRLSQVELERHRSDIVDLEQQLEVESERMVNQLNKEKAALAREAAALKEKLKQTKPAVAHEHLYELAEEVIRLRALLVTTGRTSDEKETRRLERLDSLEEENTHLRRKLHRLEGKVAELERAQVQAESDHEISEERAFNMQRSDSPHATAHPISISPRMGRRQVPVPPPATVSPVSSSPSYGIARPMMARHHPHTHPRSIDDMRARSGSDVSTTSTASSFSAANAART